LDHAARSSSAPLESLTVVRISTVHPNSAMNRALLLCAAIATALSSARAQSTCADAFRDSLSANTLRVFERVASVAPVWDDYTFSRHPLLLLADSAYRGHAETPVCASVWRAGRPLERIELSARPPFSTPLYGMIDSDSIGPRAIDGAADIAVVARKPPSAVAAALRSRGIARVVVFNVPMNLAALGRLGEMLIAAKADPARIQADLAVHESFHLHSQFPTWLDQTRTYAWPAWDLQPDRTELRQRCYAGSPELSEALKAEIQTLVAAYDAVSGDSSKRDAAAGLRHAQQFIESRAARRKLQDTMTVAQGRRRISCAQAEDLMELEEGATQWIGHATSLSAGLTNSATLRGPYAGTQAEAFYQTGPLQLWVLDGLLGRDALRRITTAIAHSTAPETGSVHAQFTDHVRRLAQGRGRSDAAATRRSDPWREHH